MGKKRRKYPNVEEILSRPWCYYCERDFEDLKLLISHQKAKHFKCDRCGRRLNTAGGLSVHMNQVHKETLTQVENALPNRQGLDVEIFGMEGIPADVLEHHRNRIIQNFYQAQEDRRIATGNPVPGGSKQAKKKIKYETKEELLGRFHEHQARVRANKAAGISGGMLGAPGAPGANGTPAAFNPTFPPPDQFGQPGFQGPPGGGSYPQQFTGGTFGGLPPRPASGAPGGATGLPQRPGYPGGFYNGPGAAPGSFGGNASSLDELVSNAAQQGDDIDKLIRMAEAGIRPPRKDDADEAPVLPAAEEAGDKKSKKEKGRMVYSDSETSPEERMAQLPRYAFVPGA